MQPYRQFTGNKLLLATNNENKVAELKECLVAAGLTHIQLFTPADFSLESPAETEPTFVGNAKLKAKYYGDLTHLPALADDTGICIEALGGRPGVHTADWLRDPAHSANPINSVLKELKLVGFNKKKAKTNAICAQALYWPEDQHFEVAVAEVDGHLDFKYNDPEKYYKDEKVIGFRGIFVPIGVGLPLAMLTPAEFKKVSHRAHALEILLRTCFIRNSL